MRHYKIYRLAVMALIIALLVIGWLDYGERIDQRITEVGFGITAGLLAVVAAFAIKPPGEEVAEAFTGAVATLPEDVLTKLRERTIQAEELQQYIDVTSHEIFLKKMEDVLRDAVISRYAGSELERLMLELDGVERELRRANLLVSPKELPERLRRTIAEIRSSKDRANALDQILAEVGYPPAVRSVIISSAQVVRKVLSLVYPV